MASKVLIICGPTGSGKTAKALSYGQDHVISIISADSRQIYTGLDIITGKDIPPGFTKKESDLIFNQRPVVLYEKGNVRLWGYDLLSPNEVFNAADFVILTNQIIKREQAENRQVLIVGGTGFYLKALTQPESLACVVPDEDLRHELSALSVEDLQQKLWEINPEKLLTLNDSDINNPHRLIRAIEVASSSTSPNLPSSSPHTFEWQGLSLPHEDLRLKIRARVLFRLDAGALDEAKWLYKTYSDLTLPAYTTLGIKPMLSYLKGDLTYDRLVEDWTNAEVGYAKRQITWFKKQAMIN